MWCCFVGLGQPGQKAAEVQFPMAPFEKRRLEGSSSLEYRIPVAEISEISDQERYRRYWVRAGVRLSTGAVIYSRKEITLRLAAERGTGGVGHRLLGIAQHARTGRLRAVADTPLSPSLRTDCWRTAKLAGNTPGSH